MVEKWNTSLLSPWQARCPATHDWRAHKGKWLLNIATVHDCFLFLGWLVMESKASLCFCCSGLWCKALQCFPIFNVLRRKLIPWSELKGIATLAWLRYHQPSDTPHVFVIVSTCGYFCRKFNLYDTQHSKHMKECIMVTSENFTKYGPVHVCNG